MFKTSRSSKHSSIAGGWAISASPHDHSPDRPRWQSRLHSVAGAAPRSETPEWLCPTKRFRRQFPSLAKEGLGVVRSTTTQICSEVDRTTPSPLLCQGGEAFAKVVSLGKAAPHSRSITEHAAGTPLDVGGGME